MTIQLPDDLETYLRSEVRSGRFASEQDAIAEAVRLLRRSEREGSAEPRTSRADDLADGADDTAWEIVLQEMGGIPEEVIDRIPVDSSEQHDHYIYGTPKRPSR